MSVIMTDEPDHLNSLPGPSAHVRRAEGGPNLCGGQGNPTGQDDERANEMSVQAEKKAETLPRSWYCELKEENIERVAEMIRARLTGKSFAIASASVVNRPFPRLELRTGCSFEPNWTDGSPEPVRVMQSEGGRRRLAFSAGRYFWMFYPEKKEPTTFSFDHDGFEVSFVAPCGDRHTHYFRAEPEREATNV